VSIRGAGSGQKGGSETLKSRDVVISVLVLCAIVGCAVTSVESTPTASPSAPTPVPTPTPPAIPARAPVADGSSDMVEKLTIEDLTARADCILVGTVVDAQSSWDTQRTTIHTVVTIAVELVLKGCSDQQQIPVTVPGGTVDGISMGASASPSFHSRERAVLFLQREGDLWTILGSFQGKLPIEEDIVCGPGVSLSRFLSRIEEILP
jgi:hypothetical protein